MGHNGFLRALALAAMTFFCSLTLADPPSRVGRISAIVGQVTWRDTNSGDAMAALINWPLISRNQIETARLARAELRLGSTALSLDSDSKLDIEQLDDTHFKVRLQYGSVAVRIKSRELVSEFELHTPQGRLWLTEPSVLRVDTERVGETSVVSVFSGGAQFEGVGARLPLRAGKRVDISEDGIHTRAVTRDDFDDWNLARDEREQRSVSARYVSPETTGYEELDHYGTWQMTAEDGAIWIPNQVPADWAPYRDGRWTWLEPWGWTWVDNAPWGYAPSHYGRWFWRRDRWCWTPGTLVARPVWTPALVGWIDEPNWSLRFSIGGTHRSAPAVGWFPLAPRETYMPVYPVSPGYVQRVNNPHLPHDRHGRQAPAQAQNSGAGQVQPHYRNRDVRNAVTSLPHDQFVTRRTVVVGAPLAGPRTVLQNPPAANPPPATVPAAPRRTEADANAPHGRSILHGRPDQPGPVRMLPQPSQAPAITLVPPPTPTPTPQPTHRQRPAPIEAGPEMRPPTHHPGNANVGARPAMEERHGRGAPVPAPAGEIRSIHREPPAPRPPEAQQRVSVPTAPPVPKNEPRVEKEKRRERPEENAAPAEPAARQDHPERQEQRHDNRSGPRGERGNSR